MSISASTSVAALPVPVAKAVDREVRLRCFSYEERFGAMAVMLEALDQCGCWMESREAVSATQVEMLFATRLAAADELYSGLVGTGVEMTQESHRAMTMLCTRWRHQPEDASRFATIRVRLEVNFLQVPEVEIGFVAHGLA